MTNGNGEPKDDPQEEAPEIQVPENVMKAHDVAIVLMEQVMDAINSTGVELGFVFGLVGPPTDYGEGDIHQPFYFRTNCTEIGSVVGMLGRCMEQVARSEARSVIVKPGELPPQ